MGGLLWGCGMNACVASTPQHAPTFRPLRVAFGGTVNLVVPSSVCLVVFLVVQTGQQQGTVKQVESAGCPFQPGHRLYAASTLGPASCCVYVHVCAYEWGCVCHRRVQTTQQVAG